MRYRFSFVLAFCLLPVLGGLQAFAAESSAIPVKGFEEVLIPVGIPSAEDRNAVVSTREQFLARGDSDDLSAWSNLLAARPNSPYALAIWTNLGILQFRQAKFSSCIDSYENAWKAGKEVRDQPAEAIAGRAVGELAMMYARLGRYETLDALLKETEQRPFRGPGGNLLQAAQSGFTLMTESPQTSFRCGPMALYRILASQKVANPLPPEIANSVSTRNGMSLLQVKEIASAVGLKTYKPAKRSPGSAILLPSVVHWKVGHYAALVAERDGRYLVEDPTFATALQIWVTPETLDAEGSGYFLADTTSLPTGWTEVPDAEASTVWGKGQTGENDPDSTGPNDKKAKKGDPHTNRKPGGCGGMAEWDVHLMLISLNIMDEPLAYKPPVGPAVSVLLTYNSRENETISTPVHTNFGPKWNYNGLAYVNDTGGTAFVRSGTGGVDKYTPSGVANEYLINKNNFTKLRRISADPHFERLWPDGTKELYENVGPTGLAYRTKIIDPSGNQLEYRYLNNGSTILLHKIVDEIGQETVFEYAGGGASPTKVTDPFGRFARFEYDGEGRLDKIIDPVGIASSFEYDAATDFINRLITPYGATTFSTGIVSATRWLQVTHPNGDLERAEYRHNAEGIPNNVGPGPAGMLVASDYNNYRNSLYWDRKAMKEAPGDVSKARLTHFLHTAASISVTSGLVESEKAPLEGRVFYNYENQSNPYIESDSSRVSKVGRLLDDGSSQVYQMEYNAIGKVTSTIDPLGRTTQYTYASNLTDLLKVRQKTGPSSTELLSSFTYDTQGHPLTSTDVSGEVTTFTYNTRGQVLTATDPLGNTNTFTYDTNGYLLSVDGPAGGTGDSITYTYDSAGRVLTATSSSGGSMEYTYDNLDRVTKVTYSDGQFEQWTYENVSVKSYRDRTGRTTTYQINSLGQIVEAGDQNNNKTFYGWCKCGAMSKMIDPAGNMTRITHDVQGRPTSKIYPDGSTSTILYGPVSGRVAKIVDEEGREQIFTYAADDALLGITFANSPVATPAVTYTWDPIYSRITGYTDGSGATSMQYHPIAPGQAGAGKISSIDGPLTNDTISLTYDAAGRASSRSIGGSAEDYLFDSLNRPTTVTNALGAFTYTYDGASGRAASITFPNGQTSTFDYSSGTLRMLKEIVNTGPGSTPISKFTYAYNSKPRISSFTRQIDSGSALVDTPSYDAQDRLSQYQKALTGGSTKNYTYVYDSAQNRTLENIDGTETTASINNLNQVTSSSSPLFSDRTYEWDAIGRLSAYVQGTHRTEFTYDAVGRRVRILEKENGSTTGDRKFVWAGLQIVEERDASDNLVKRFFSQGFQQGGNSYFYTRDHLGSIREVVDQSGTVRARYDYDPYGRRVLVSGDVEADFGFCGQLFHQPSGLGLTYARAYDPNLGRWLSRDPLGESKGLNLYAYAFNDPLNFYDPVGHDSVFGAWANPQAVLDQASANLMQGMHDAVVDFQNLTAAAQAALCLGVVLTPGVGEVAIAGAVVNGGLATYSASVGAANKVSAQFGVDTGLSGTATVDAVSAAGYGEDSSCDLRPAAQIADGALNIATGRAIQTAAVSSAPEAVGIGVDFAAAVSYGMGTADGGYFDPIIDAAKEAGLGFDLPDNPPRAGKGPF